ncbi:uncharacterized protein LOC111408951 [Olea europaea var. sylvestris]|uniref:uncharacterized protein LOC111408951 n=1 Tax=Olea europaea var. sylvestris TaxID=158386 RepID=UPI000C1D355E|nr:uncharacterized protein LOC111408951 [Olea europaea var. sylvestris]
MNFPITKENNNKGKENPLTIWNPKNRLHLHPVDGRISSMKSTSGRLIDESPLGRPPPAARSTNRRCKIPVRQPVLLPLFVDSERRNHLFPIFSLWSSVLPVSDIFYLQDEGEECWCLSRL